MLQWDTSFVARTLNISHVSLPKIKQYLQWAVLPQSLPPRLSLFSLAASPTGHRRREYNTDRPGAPSTQTQDGRDAGGRWSISSLAEPRYCTSITPWCLFGGDVASYERGKGEILNPWLSLLAAASFCHQDIAPQTKGRKEHRCSRIPPGGPAEITWLRWLRLLKLFRCFGRLHVLKEFCVSAALNDALHSGHILHSVYALNPNKSATGKVSPNEIIIYFNHFIWLILPETFFFF